MIMIRSAPFDDLRHEDGTFASPAACLAWLAQRPTVSSAPCGNGQGHAVTSILELLHVAENLLHVRGVGYIHNLDLVAVKPPMLTSSLPAEVNCSASLSAL